MTFDNCFTLYQMMAKAEEQMTRTEEQLHAIDTTLNSRLDGRSRLSMLGAVIISAVWAVAFLFAYGYSKKYIPGLYELPLLGVSLALVAFVIIDDFVQLKYYGTIFNAQEQLKQLHNRVAMGQSSLTENLKVFLDQQDAQWELPLEAGASINEEAIHITAQLSNMETLSAGVIAKIKNALYYVVCLGWTAAGSYVFFIPVAVYLNDFSYDTLKSIRIAAIVIACVLEALVAKWIWSKTHCDVGNLTLLSTALGPLIFICLILLVIVVVFVVQLLLYLAGIAIGIACLFGSICGG